MIQYQIAFSCIGVTIIAYAPCFELVREDSSLDAACDVSLLGLPLLP
jgi:hypothetical protein